MKRFFGLLVVLALFISCDDGDMQVESFDFSSVSSAKCGTGESDFFIYKTRDNEALILQLSESVFKNAKTPPGAPIIVDINGTSVKVIYRLYSGTVTGNELCTTIPPASPSVVEEWNATGGKIEIITNVVQPRNDTTGANFITGFSHTITFRNITFNTGSGTQTNEELSFGSYVTSVIPPADFTPLEVKSCEGKSVIYKNSGPQALTLTFDPAVFTTLFANASTPTNAPRIQLVDGANTITYRRFNTSINEDDFCNGTTPTLLESWMAKEGVSAVSGIIEVSTTTIGADFEHTITLRNVIFKNNTDDLEFTFGTNYVLGTYITSI